MITALKLSASLVLGIAYLAVAWACAHPKVTPEYAAHFFHRTAECWNSQPDATPPKVIELGKVPYPEACRYLRWGWYPVEDWGVWSHLHGATLNIPRRPGAHAVVLTVRAASAPGPDVGVRLSWPGHELKLTVPTGSTQAVELPLPPNEPDGLTVHIQPLDPASVGAGSASMGLGLIKIEYQ